MKKGLRSYTAFEITLYRILVVFIVFIPLCIKKFTSLSKKDFLIISLTGLIGSAIPYFLFIKAQTFIDSSLNGILNSITPLFTILFGTLLFNQKFNLKTVIGVVTGLVGAMGLIITANGGDLSLNVLIYSLLPLAGSACYALNLNIIKIYLSNTSAVLITGVSFFIIGPISGILLVYQTEFLNQIIYNDTNQINLIYITLLGVIGTGFAVWLFNLLIKETSSVFASSVTYLIPIVAIIWGIIDGEGFSIFEAIFCFVIFAGVYLIRQSPQKS
tara:strand:+ start:1157 stop:1972 length:816 start_codon:yes stop_codon:yes gene_type:complete